MSQQMVFLGNAYAALNKEKKGKVTLPPGKVLPFIVWEVKFFWCLQKKGNDIFTTSPVRGGRGKTNFLVLRSFGNHFQP
jgi:hypothetical protein